MALENISNVPEVCSPLPTNNVSKSVWLDLSPKDYQNRGEDTKNCLGGEPPFAKPTNRNTMDFII